MFFKDAQEIIIKYCSTFGVATDQRSSHWVYVSEDKKRELRHTLEYKLNRMLDEDRQHIVNYKNEEINFISEVMNRVPMLCNFLTASAYRRVLFVGHYDASQYHWFHNNKKWTPHRNWPHVWPKERSHLRYMPDFNVLSQFIPLLIEHLNYKITGQFVKPQDSRHTSNMHKLYDEMLIQSGDHFTVFNSEKQYKHGMSSSELGLHTWDFDGKLFDAVVFLGVPNKDENGFSVETLKETFGLWIHPDCHFVDFWLGDETNRFKDSENHEHQAERSLGEVMHVRGSWDPQIKRGGRGEEYDLLRKFIKVYRRSNDEDDSQYRAWTNY